MMMSTNEYHPNSKKEDNKSITKKQQLSQTCYGSTSSCRIGTTTITSDTSNTTNVVGKNDYKRVLEEKISGSKRQKKRMNRSLGLGRKQKEEITISASRSELQLLGKRFFDDVGVDDDLDDVGAC